MKTELHERMRFARQRLSLTQEDVAEKMGVSRAAVGLWESPDKKNGPTRNNLIRFADALGIPFEWLANDESTLEEMTGAVMYKDEDGGFVYTGNGPLLKTPWRPRKSESSREGYLRIARLAVEASAGGGVENNDYPEVIDHIDIAEARARAFFGRFPRESEVAVVTMRGDSMEPDYLDGDAVLIDTTRNRYDSDGVYLFTLNGSALLKRLQMKPDGIRVISTNSRYEPYTIPKADIEGLRIIGRVAASLLLRGL